MSLVTRLTAFFLAALALVLAGFSLSLYLLARAYLFGQAEDRLQAALETLAAAVEPQPSGLEWEGGERRLALGRGDGLEQPRWEVRDGEGRLVDRSPNLQGEALHGSASFGFAGAEVMQPLWRDRDGIPWLFAQRSVRAESLLGMASGEPLPNLYLRLELAAGVPLVSAYTTLRTLAATLTAISLGLWLAAALLGRWLCRRALAPVAEMAKAARAMGTADLSERLPGVARPDELGELQRAFNGLLDRLQEAFERQRRFTGDASHQLRTPLAAMLGQLDLALRRDRPAPEYHRVLGAVHTQAERLRQIVEALLFLARADVEANPGALDTVDLAAWLPGQLTAWATHARAADLRPVRWDGGPLPVHVQPVLLGQLLDNLLDNALKHTSAGTAVTVTLGQDGNMATLAVEDRGSGIAPEDLPHVFAPFYRAAAARGAAGAGLGLAVARRIAAAFGGTLTATSEPGKGSCFTLRLGLVGGE